MTTKTDFEELRTLLSYRPADRHFTSASECSMIAEALELESRSAIELNNVRDMCVLLFTRDSAGDDEMDRIAAMQSITAVIDGYIMRKFQEV